MVMAVTQERPQMGDDMLHGVAREPLAAVCDETLDIPLRDSVQRLLWSHGIGLCVPKIRDPCSTGLAQPLSATKSTDTGQCDGSRCGV